ncbi:MAG TPA: TrmO family methyltransferase [Spirochaetota bacterium]|nr:TrmO family methyltransferase [Spirochaetota bacterium]
MKSRCEKCKNPVDKDNACVVDGVTICNRCMYGDVEPLVIYPIGVVRNTQKRAPVGFGVISKSGVSKIELNESQKPFMYKLEEEPGITVVYHLHKSKPVRSVFRRGLDGKKTGVFATRTPDRLSGIAIQDVKLVKIEGTTIYVEGLDAIDGSPVLDIKMCWHNPEVLK